MRAFASVIGFITVAAAGQVRSAPTSGPWVEYASTPTAAPARATPKPSKAAIDQPASEPDGREEVVRFLGFSDSESVGAFAVTVREERHGRMQTFAVIRVISTTSEKVVDTFRQGPPSTHPEWLAARPESLWNRMRPHSGFHSKQLDVSKSVFRLAIVPEDYTRSEAKKTHIEVKGREGSDLRMTPVVRLYDQRRVYLGAIDVAGAPGRVLDAKVEAFHSRTGNRLAVLTHYTSNDGAATDIGRLFTTPGDPIGTHEVGAFQSVATSEQIAERIFVRLHPELTEAFARWGRD